MTGTNALITFNVPKKFVSMFARTSSSGTSATPPRLRIAAL
jgi:hypothetical protein